MPESKSRRAPRRDATLLDAEDVARAGALEVAKTDTVGSHLESRMVADRLALHRFESLDPGYPGWVWEVTVARAPRSKSVIVCEVGLFPAEGALVAPPWVPWSDRLRPCDISRDDVLPYNANDPRLVSGFEQTDEVLEDVHAVEEMGLGRARVLSHEGISDAATRWYDSKRGPVPGLKPQATCGTCGFLLKMGGSLGQTFGVCANEWATDDGCVVSLDHGCGAHSETDTKQRRPQWPIIPSRLDDFELDIEEIDDM